MGDPVMWTKLTGVIVAVSVALVMTSAECEAGRRQRFRGFLQPTTGIEPGVWHFRTKGKFDRDSTAYAGRWKCKRLGRDVAKCPFRRARVDIDYGSGLSGCIVVLGSFQSRRRLCLITGAPTTLCSPEFTGTYRCLDGAAGTITWTPR